MPGGWAPGTPVLSGAEIRELIVAALMETEGEWRSTGQIALALGIREETAREHPPYRELWFGRNGYPCCPGCTDPDHIVTRRYPYTASDVRPHLKALERQGRIRCAGKHATFGQAATWFWYTTDQILSETP